MTTQNDNTVLYNAGIEVIKGKESNQIPDIQPHASAITLVKGHVRPHYYMINRKIQNYIIIIIIMYALHDYNNC